MRLAAYIFAGVALVATNGFAENTYEDCSFEAKSCQVGTGVLGEYRAIQAFRRKQPAACEVILRCPSEIRDSGWLESDNTAKLKFSDVSLMSGSVVSPAQRLQQEKKKSLLGDFGKEPPEFATVRFINEIDSGHIVASHWFYFALDAVPPGDIGLQVRLGDIAIPVQTVVRKQALWKGDAQEALAFGPWTLSVNSVRVGESVSFGRETDLRSAKEGEHAALISVSVKPGSNAATQSKAQIHAGLVALETADGGFYPSLGTPRYFGGFQPWGEDTLNTVVKTDVPGSWLFFFSVPPDIDLERAAVRIGNDFLATTTVRKTPGAQAEVVPTESQKVTKGLYEGYEVQIRHQTHGAEIFEGYRKVVAPPGQQIITYNLSFKTRDKALGASTCPSDDRCYLRVPIESVLLIHDSGSQYQVTDVLSLRMSRPSNVLVRMKRKGRSGSVQLYFQVPADTDPQAYTLRLNDLFLQKK